MDIRERFDVSLEDLQTFLLIAKTGSFTEAARQLNLSQPSISNRLRRLEEKLGTRLIVRGRWRVALTADGERLHGQASVTLAALNQLFRDFRGESAARRLQVDVSATVMIATLALPRVVSDFGRDHPGIAVRIHDHLPDAARQALIAGDCDLAVMASDDRHSGLDYEPLHEERCVVVAPLGHSILGKGPIPLAEVLRHPILSPDVHTELRRSIAAEAQSRGLEFVIAPQACSVSNLMTLLAMASAGLGLCIHPRSLVPPEFAPMVGVAEIADATFVRPYKIVTATGRNLSPAARSFREAIRATSFWREAAS